MHPNITVRPSKELRNNYRQISALCRSNPVAITANGKEDIVVMSYETFVDQQRYIRDLEARLAIYTHLAQALDDVKLGRTQSMDEVFEDTILIEVTKKG